MGDQAASGPGGHLRCPFCGTYDVGRLYVAPLDMDTCDCRTCEAQWDEDRRSGSWRGRGRRASVIAPRSA